MGDAGLTVNTGGPLVLTRGIHHVMRTSCHARTYKHVRLAGRRIPPAARPKSEGKPQTLKKQESDDTRVRRQGTGKTQISSLLARTAKRKTRQTPMWLIAWLSLRLSAQSGLSWIGYPYALTRSGKIGNTTRMYGLTQVYSLHCLGQGAGMMHSTRPAEA